MVISVTFAAKQFLRGRPAKPKSGAQQRQAPEKPKNSTPWHGKGSIYDSGKAAQRQIEQQY